MKILHLTKNYDLGGVAISAMRLHNLLRLNGVGSQIYNEQVNLSSEVICPLSSKQRILRRGAMKLSKVFSKYILRQNPAYFSTGLIPSPWLRYLQNSEADIIHLHSLGNEILSLRQIGLLEKPLVITLHDHWLLNCGLHVVTHEEIFQSQVFTKLRNKITNIRNLSLANKQVHLVAPSNFIKLAIEKDGFLSRLPVTVIPHPLPYDKHNKADKETARQLLFLKQNAKYLLFAADPFADPNKGFDKLINAINPIADHLRDSNVELIVLAEKNIEIENRVAIPVNCFGRVSSKMIMAKLMLAADLLVMPSQYESFGLVAQEAKSFGLPVLCSDGLGMADIITPENGTCVNYEDIATTTHELLRYVKAKTKYEKEIENCVVYNNSVMQKYREIYETLLI